MYDDGDDGDDGDDFSFLSLPSFWASPPVSYDDQQNDYPRRYIAP
jgi:hypothetical protein